MRKIIKYLTIIGIAGAVVMAGLYFLSSKNGQSTGVSAEPFRETYTVTKGDILRTLQLEGKVRSMISENVVSSVNARIKKVLVEDGDMVEKGQLLILLNENDLKSTLESKRSSYIKAKTTLEELKKWETTPTYLNAKYRVVNALADLDEKKQTYQEDLELYDAKAISRQDLDRSMRDMKRAEIDLKTAQAEFEETKSKGNKSALQQARSEFICAEIDFRDAQAAMKHKEIGAPCTGIVTIQQQSTQANGEANKAVSANRSVSPGDILMTIEDRGRLAVSVRLNEYDVYNISENQNCTIMIPALPGRPFTGRVVSISPKSSDREEPFFQMICQIDEIDLPLKFGMSAYVQLVLKERKDVLVVPTSALVTKNMRTGVYVPGKTEPEFCAVSIGVKNYDLAEVLNGLTQGQQILCRVPASLLVSGGADGAHMMGRPPQMPPGFRPPSGMPGQPPREMPTAAPPGSPQGPPPGVS